MIIALLFCIFTVNIYGLEHCSGPAEDSLAEFKVKYDAAPIVAYGIVTDVKSNTATFKVNCTIKGHLPIPTLELSQFTDVTNLTECHYLTANKNYVVFLDSMKTSGVESKILYRLADMEEIEITSETINHFIHEQCEEEEDYDIEMTMFIANNNLKCEKVTAVCNKISKASIPAFNYPPITKDAPFLGGFKKTVSVPKMDPNDDETISGKQNGGISDEHFHGSATNTIISMPIVIFMIGLTMIFNI